MLNGKETGIGPALRVLRHFTEREPFYQIKFHSGERALLLAAGMPAPSVELVRLALGGLLPWQTSLGIQSDKGWRLQRLYSQAKGDVFVDDRAV